MNVSEMLDVMNESPYGIYAVDSDQRIVYWNSAAERILGYKSEEATGRRCYEVCASLPPNGTAPICIEGCPSLILARRSIKPPVAHVRDAREKLKARNRMDAVLVVQRRGLL